MDKLTQPMMSVKALRYCIDIGGKTLMKVARDVYNRRAN